jgi:outer membrane protein assembly factor BamB
MNTQQLRLIDKATNADVWKSAPLASLQYLQYGQPNFRTVCAVQGTVGAINLGHMVYAFDLLEGTKLWQFNLYQPGTNQTPVLGQVMRDRDGNLVLLFQDGWTLKLGQAGPMAPGFVVVQSRSGLTALDLLKGTVRWTRADVNANRTQVFGDGEHIFLAEMNADGVAGPSTRALRTADGLAERVTDFGPAYRDRVRVLGSSILVRAETAKNLILRLYDPLAGEKVWEHTRPAGTLLLKSEEDVVGLVEPDGTLTVIDLPAGNQLFRTALKKEHLDKVNEGHLLADAGQFYVVLNQPLDANNAPGGVWPNVYHGMRCLNVNGTVYGLGLDGKVLWHNPVSRQMLVREQLADLPFLIFTARTSEWINQGGNRVNQHVVTLKTIAKSNGKLLIDKQLHANINNFHTILTDPQAGTIDLVSFNMKIRHTQEKADGK